MLMMEFQLTFSEWATISILTFIFLILICNKIKPRSSNPKLPPGPWRLPLIGHMHHLIGCLPHQKMRDLALKHGPVMYLQLGELPNIIISSREAAEQVLKTHDLIFAQRPRMRLAKGISYDYKDITFSPYGDYYRQLRKIVTVELLAAKRVLSFRSIREEETSKLVESISSVKSGSAIDFSKMITSLIYQITSRAAFGRVLEGENVFVTCFEKLLFELGRGISIADAYPSTEWLQMFSRSKTTVDKFEKQLDQAIQTILDHHRYARSEATAENSVDKEHLVDVLLNLQEKGGLQFPLTDETIKAIMLDAFSGGTDTSSTTLEWAMSELMKNPHVMEKAQGDVREKCNAKGRVDEVDLLNMDYLRNVIKETFRLHPTVPLLVPRECKESCVIDDYDILPKFRVMINTWAMGRV